MNERVTNEKHDVLPNNETFNDWDMLHDTLTSLKHLGTTYGMACTEASNKHFLKEIEPLAKETNKLARDCYNLMFVYGWYPIFKENEQRIVSVCEKFESYKSQICD